ncbi:hypothetical protein ID866_7233 [Astraeus odoratus]|nr:hypothetical protein ID866_7233 [Astraeus odoratus]
MSQEATAIVVQNKRLNPSVHNIIWQVGGVGVHDMVFDVRTRYLVCVSHIWVAPQNGRFHHFVDRLEDFGPNHKVIHYTGAVLLQSTTIIGEFSVADLRKEEVVKQINAASTFFVPPRESIPFDRAATQKFSFPGSISDTPLMRRFPYCKLIGALSNDSSPYGLDEKAAVKRLATHAPLENTSTLQASPAIRQFMTDLALNPNLLAQYKANSAAVVDSIPELSELEKLALKLDQPGPIYAIMRSNPAVTSCGEEINFDKFANAPNEGMAAFSIIADLVLVFAMGDENP